MQLAIRKVQLATLVKEPPAEAGWLHEIKLDGYRLLAFVASGEVLLRTRNRQNWTAKSPSTVGQLIRLKVKDAVLDMEPVALTEEGKSSFQALQAALSEHANSIIAYLFDILHLDGTDLTLQPLRARKKILQKLLNGSKSNILRYSEHVKRRGANFSPLLCKAGLEEIVSKEAASPYRPGRQNSWLKSKCTLRREFIIVGYSGARSGERALGALQLAYHKVKALQYAGKVGTGFTLRSAKELAARLQKLTRQTSPLDQEEMAKLTAKERNSAHWVTPKLLCEVEFTEATNDGQLRHPSFRGLREDKRQQGAGKEEPIAN